MCVCVCFPSVFSQKICDSLKEGLPQIQQRLKSFGSMLPMATDSSSSIPESDMELGHIIIAEILESLPEGTYVCMYEYYDDVMIT